MLCAIVPRRSGADELRRIETLASESDWATSLLETLAPDQQQAIRARIIDERPYPAQEFHVVFDGLHGVGDGFVSEGGLVSPTWVVKLWRRSVSPGPVSPGHSSRQADRASWR